jgi:hypothetical protein
MSRWAWWLFFTLVGCEAAEEVPPVTSPGESAPTEEIRVPIQGRTRLRLEDGAVVGPDDPWDLAVEGYGVFTNSGPSGSGKGAAFGPLSAEDFDRPVNIPFTIPDRSGGAFLDWYAYEGAPAHVLWSRFHVHAVRDGARLWKVQILGYYGQIDGAPVTGVYRVRYAELTPGGAGPTVELSALDATAGGANSPPTAPSSCLDLGSGAVTPLTPEQAAQSAAWHLCFRRQNVSVNGGTSGPRGVEAADLQAGEVASETLAEVKKRTATSEEERFARVTRADAEGAAFTVDGVRSAFGASWVDRSASPPAPAPASWVVVGADGQRRYRVQFTRFEGADASGPGVVFLRVRPE